MFRLAALRLARAPAAAAPARSFAAAAVESVSLPRQYTVPGRYAAALYQVAARAGQLDAVAGDLKQVGEILEKSKDFSQFVTDPTVERATKSKGLEGVLEGLQANELTRNFVRVLLENRRLEQLPKVLEAYDEIASLASGKVTATITTAEPWSAEDLSEIRTRLNAIAGKGKGDVELVENVDPAILGGLVIDLDDKHIDLSIATRVRKLQKLILEASI